MAESYTRLRAAKPREDDTIRQNLRAEALRIEQSVPEAVSRMQAAGARLQEVAERVLRKKAAG